MEPDHKEQEGGGGGGGKRVMAGIQQRSEHNKRRGSRGEASHDIKLMYCAI